MDVERIQKINAMALELMKQGLAADREDAVVQAEKIFKTRGGAEYASLRDTMHKVDSSATLESKPTGENGSLSQDQIKDILEQNTKFMARKLKEIEEKLAALEKDISSINSKILSVQRSAAAPAETIQRGPNPSVSAANHPRSGSYNESDVSIEKFFYMGRK